MTTERNTQNRIASLRKLLDQGPCASSFDSIFYLFSPSPWTNKKTSPEELHLELEYAQSHLSSWPNEERAVDISQCWPTLPRGKPHPAFPLIRTLFYKDFEEEKIEAATVLAQEEKLQNIRRMCFSESDLGDKVVSILVKSNYLQDLEDLELYQNNIGDRGTIAIANANTFPKLKKLVLGDNKIGNKGAIALANAKNLVNLKSLNLSANNIGDEGALALIHSPNLPSLEKLDLSINPISDDVREAAKLKNSQ